MSDNIKGSNKIRVQKYLSSNGIASRRKSEEMIIAGLIKINGKTAIIGDKIIPGKDKVFVGGKLISPIKTEKIYIMLNKPRGYITTMQDEQDRKCVADLIKDIDERVYPVGRLDKESEGLLIMTNDGEFANKITHPSNHISKVYRVTVKPSINNFQIARICEGIEIDGYTTAPALVNVVSEEVDRTVIEITIYEGKNRQIRKMCEELGLEIARLKRISIGGISLKGLPIGKWRKLNYKDIEKLYKLKAEN